MEEYNLDDYKYDYRSGNPAVYVGTYHKRNCGSIFGEWFDLTKFADYDEFIDVCRYLHSDEEDPELMAQDFENFPKRWYTEGFMSEEEFDKILEWNDLDDGDKEMLEAYIEHSTSNYADIEEAREHCEGKFDSEYDFAYYIVDELGYLNEMPEHLRYYFDYEAFARDIFMSDYTFDGAYVWREV